MDINAAIENMNPVQQAGWKAAAFAVQVDKNITPMIDGNAVMKMASYLRTNADLSESERIAALGIAFDVYAGAVRRGGQ